MRSGIFPICMTLFFFCSVSVDLEQAHGKDSQNSAQENPEKQKQCDFHKIPVLSAQNRFLFVFFPGSGGIIHFGGTVQKFQSRRSSSSTNSPKSLSALLTGAGVDISTPAILSKLMGSALLPEERNFL